MKQLVLFLVACAMTMSVMGQVSDTQQQNPTTASAATTEKTNPVNATVSQDPVSGNMTFTVNGVSFTMVAVQGGTFTMGGTAEQGKDGDVDELPTHQVTLSSYYIGETEVTQALWMAVMGNTHHSPWWAQWNMGDLFPAQGISWTDCQAFVHKLSEITGKTFRLPTEAEWEFAARGGNKSHGYKYSGSNKLSDISWYGRNSEQRAHNVKTRQPNELGLYDMSGNVWEWCQDSFLDYTEAAQTNPVVNTGLEDADRRVIRGGCWHSISSLCRTTVRDGFFMLDFAPILGLRVVMDE